jgi:hypothetical protein
MRKRRRCCPGCVTVRAGTFPATAAYTLGLTISDGGYLLQITAILVTSLLFGGMVLYSFGFAALLFHALPGEEAGRLLRTAFPFYYLWLLATATLAALLFIAVDRVGLALLSAVALSTVLARQMLMPAINRATDAGMRRRFATLHGLSVVLALLQMGATGWALVRLAA